jgi:integrase
MRTRFEDEHLSGLARRTMATYGSAMNAYETICRPQKPADLTTTKLSYFQAELRRRKKSESTIATYLRHLKYVITWCIDMGMLTEAQRPKCKMPQRAKGSQAKGRAVTGEEFDRMIAAVEKGLLMPLKPPKVKKTDRVCKLGEDALKARRERAATVAPSWRHLLEGLWWSGLRIDEAMNLSWDEPDKILVNMGGRRPMFKILAELEKGHKDRLLPMTPDFAGWLEHTSAHERTGPVFNPLSLDGKRVGTDYASKRISKVGKAANVKVADRQGKVKFASAHDLRRSFGFRWAIRVQPAVLQQLMRHESIETTMKYYVTQDAEAVADVLWDGVPAINTFVNSSV